MKTDDTYSLILVDGSSYLYRAYHALPPLTTAKGEPTGAMVGVINMVLKLKQQYKSPYFAVVFDAKGKSFRHDLYQQYKANRAAMPDDLQPQIKPLHQIITAMGMPLLCVPGVEADDVIGTLTKQAVAANKKVLIATGDKDLAQLVNDKVQLIDTMKGVVLDDAGVTAKFGVSPQQIVDYLSLIGDSSDNVPGIPGVGPKTAVKWLQKFGSLDAIAENHQQITGKVGERLAENLKTLPVAKQLITLKTDVELDKKYNNLVTAKIDIETLEQLCQHYELKSVAKQLSLESHAAVVTQESVTTEYEIVTSSMQLKNWLQQLQQAQIFAFDVETTSLNYMEAEIVGVSVAVDAKKACYIPCGHDYENAPTQIARTELLQQIKPILEDNSKAKIGHNLKYDANVLGNYGIEINNIAHDTMLASYVLNSTMGRHDLDSTAKRYLDYDTIHYEDVAGKGAKQINFSQVPLEQAGPYAAEDAAVTLMLQQHLWPLLQKEKSLQQVYTDIEMPLVPVLTRMERIGVKLDIDKLKIQSAELEKKMQKISKKAHKLAGEEFNFNSPKQLQRILFEEQGLPVMEKTPKGQPSTAEPALQFLAQQYELPELILEYRQLSKIKSTYTDALPAQVNSKTGRLHTSYHQAVTATGRLSSSDPNLQNIPIRNEEGRRVRQAFIAKEGYKIVSADYSQIELRIMAHLSNDATLLKAFKQGLDIHKATACEIFAEEADDVTKEQRRFAKVINFGLIYGMSAFGLARQLGVDRGEAQSYIDKYFERYPGVLQYMEDTRKHAKEKGYVSTIFGRRLYLPDINARNVNMRRAAERTAINAPMQGTAADIIKKAMITVDKWILQQQVPVSMIMQVHDELVFEVKADFVETALPIILEKMAAVAELKVPLLADAGVGDNWDEAH